MAGRLKAMTAIVTGGGAGLGAAACRRFAAEGASVVVADIDGAAAEALCAEIRAGGGSAVAVAADASSAQDAEATADAALALGARIDVLYCNAGRPAVGTVGDADRAVWDAALAVMLTGAWLSMRAVIPAMTAQRSGSIIVQASVAGIVGVKALAPYTAAKAGALGLVRQAAVDYAPLGIRINAISPGDVPTALVQRTYEAQVAAGHKPHRAYADALAKATSHYPAGRLGTPDDVAGLALFLASVESSWITGQNFVVDGGLTAAGIDPDPSRRLERT
jgi:NAD(P)-dependent dehydrogenase (short-subunit alcohol dehydrogenase family)